MRTVQDLIGNNFEDFLEEIFDNLKRISSKRNNLPDFESENFYIEAKSGFQAGDRGPRIKDRQIILSKQLKKPTIYAIGYHCFADSIKVLSRYKSLHGKVKKVKDEMKIKALYLVDMEIIEAIANSRTKISEKKGEVYLSLRQGYLEQLIKDSIKNQCIPAHQFYGFETKVQSHNLINLPNEVLTSNYIGSNLDVLNFLRENNKL